jgi:hypothetical protein
MKALFQRRVLLRIAAALVAILLAAVAFLWFFALPLEARYWGRQMPILHETPVPLKNTAVADSPGRKMAFCGAEFEIPWSDVNDGKTKSGVNSTILFFESGLVATMKCLPPREFVDGVIESIHVNREKFRRAYGDRPAESDYALTRLMLETTPGSVRAFSSHRAQGPMMSLLVLKAMGTPRADTGIFSIHSAEFDGFQYEDPAAGSSPVVMNLFADDRGLEFGFFLKVNGASAHLSQPEINRIVQTLHKVGPYPQPKQASAVASK